MSANASDPTLVSLAQLDNPALYVCRRRVPIFRAHVRKDRAGKVKYRITDKDLPGIAERCNRLVEEAGVPARISLGHTRPDPDTPEPEQPEIVGWGKSFDVGPFGPKGTLAVVVDEYFLRERADEAKTYPYRSVEYYHSRGEISGIALLRRDPELDLGIVTYGRADEPTVYVEADMPDMPDPTQLPGAGSDAPDDADHHAACDRYMAKSYPRLAEMHQRYQDENPGEEGPPVGGDMPPVETPEQMQRAGVPEVYARRLSSLTGENRKLRSENARLKQDAATADARQRVSALQHEGFAIRHPEKEIERQSRMSVPERDDRCAEIREHYQRDVTAGEIIPQDQLAPLPAARGTRSNEFTTAHLERANQYMHEHPGCSWEDAERYARKELSAKR